MTPESENKPKYSKQNPAFLDAPRCGAKTRKGTPCKCPAVKGKRRCRMHGGAKGSGAQKGNKNALKHGFYTAEAVAERAEAMELMNVLNDIVEKNFG